ncbi:hypothetical protein Tco_1442397, partial [Tanacetum coccineum]
CCNNHSSIHSSSTPTPLLTTITIPILSDFSSLFEFNQRVSNLEKGLSELKQANQSAQLLATIKSQILAMVDAHLGTRLRDSIQKALRSYTAEFKKEAQAEKERYIDLIEKSMKDIINDEVKTQLPQILPKAVSDFATPVIKSTVIKSLEDAVLAKSSSQPQSTYKATTSLTEFELKKILIDKMEKIQSNLTADEHKELYKALVNSYNVDKDLFLVYGKAVSLKRGREEKDKDEDPTAGTDQGMKRRKTRKDAESSKGSKSKESKSTSSSKGTSRSQPKSSGKSAQAEELIHTVDDFEVKIAQPEKPPLSFDKLMSNPIDLSAYIMNHLKIDNLTQDHLVGPAFNLLKGTCRSRVELEYNLEECYKAVTDRLDWNNPDGKTYLFDLSKPLPLIMNRGRQVVPVDYFINNDLKYLKGGSSSRIYMTSTTKTKAAKYDIQGIEDMVPSVSKHDVYSTKRIIAVTQLKVMKWYDYGYLEEIEVRKEDQQLYKFKEGDFPRLHMHDIKDMLLLLVQNKLSNLERDVIFNLGVALQMFTRRVVILKRVEDLQLGVESYQKKLNITKTHTFRCLLMRTYELYKFSDGTLTFVRTVLHDIALNLRTDYLPKKRWSSLDRRRSRIMIKDRSAAAREKVNEKLRKVYW